MPQFRLGIIRCSIPSWFISIFISIVIPLLCGLTSIAQAQISDSGGSSKDTGAGLGINGNAEIVSNYMKYGLTHSDKGPAVRGSYLFSLGPQFRVGISSASVYYQNENQYLDIELVADIKIEINSNVDARLRYASENYYKSTTRNGDNYGIDLRLFKYIIRYKRDKNWEGTKSAANHFALGYPWDLGSGFTWKNIFEYNQIVDPAYISYYDLYSAIEYQNKPMLFALGGTYTSNADQFSGRASPSLIFSIGTEF